MFSKGPRKMNYEKCPEDYYVAMSRATEELIVIHDISMRKLPFLKNTLENISKKSYCSVNYIPPRYKQSLDIRKLEHHTKIKEDKVIKHQTSVTDLTKYIKEDILEDINNICDEIFITKQATNNKKLKTNIDGRKRKLTEQVSDITGVVIPTIWEYNKKNKTKIKEELDKRINKRSGDLIRNYSYNYPCITIRDYLRMGNLYISVVNGCENNLNQIDTFEWLTESDRDMCLLNLDTIISCENTLKFEYEIDNGVFTYKHETYGILKIGNRVDLIDDNYLYEFKCTKELTTEHKLQLLIYAWITKNITEEDNTLLNKGYRLFNIVNNELLELNYDENKVKEVMELLFINKYSETVEMNDNEFIKFINA